MVKLPKVLQRITEELALEGSLEVARGYMCERLRLVSADDLYKAINENIHTLGVAEPKDKRFGQKMAKRFQNLSYMGKKASEHLTPKMVLEWLGEDRADLASLLINMGDKGLKWLEEDLKSVHTFLWAKE